MIDIVKTNMTNEELKQYFVYEKEGRLRKIKNARKDYPWRFIGKNKRYRAYTHNNGKVYYLHRLIWQYHHGFVPKMLDHVDGDFSNNRIENLRLCTNAQNQYNSPKKENNRSGYKGVVFHPKIKNKPWQAKIVVNKKVKSLGYFASPKKAHSAYVAGANKYAKEFARHD